MSGSNTGQIGAVGRRTLAKGAAWAVPAIAVAGATPAHAASGITTTTTTLPPCVAAIGTSGGTYPVSISLSNCSTDSSHWDFIFRITAAIASSSCLCNGVQPTHLRITFFDNPKRTRLWISNNTTIGNPSTNTANSPRLYIQKVLAAGASASFPATGDVVRRVAGPSPYTGFTTGGTVIGNITAPGTADDSLHTLILPNGSLPCSLPSGTPMAYVRVECGSSAAGPWTTLVTNAPIDPCVPMIRATVCRFSTAGDDLYRVGVSVLTSCDIPASSFTVTNIQRNNDTNFPNEGNSVWSGSQQLSAGVTNIDMTDDGNNGGQLWISFSTDGGTNTSRIRVPTNNTACDAPAAPVLSLVSNTCTTSGADTRTVTVSWTGTANRLQRSTDATWGDGDDVITTVSGNSHTYSFSDDNCNSTFRFRVYQDGFDNFSNVLVVNP